MPVRGKSSTCSRVWASSLVRKGNLRLGAEEDESIHHGSYCGTMDDVKILIHVESETDGRNVWNSKFLPETESQNLYLSQPTDTSSTFARYVKNGSVFIYEPFGMEGALKFT
jgi:hypothetical protein